MAEPSDSVTGLGAALHNDSAPRPATIGTPKPVRPWILSAMATALLGAACTFGSDPAPSPGPSSSPDGNVIVTFQVTHEQFRVELTDPVDIEIARRLLRGLEAPRIPSGVVVRGDPGVNTGYSWHLDPDSVEFADATTEVCDGRPSDVEANAVTADRFCPWSAQVVAIDE